MYQLRPGGTSGSYGAVFGCSHPCMCSGLPNCLRAAFVPALILCQWGLAGSWHLDTSSSIRWHGLQVGIKNDPIRGWQCVLTGTTCSGVFKTAIFFLCSFPFLLFRDNSQLSSVFVCSSRFSSNSGWQWQGREWVCLSRQPLCMSLLAVCCKYWCTLQVFWCERIGFD